ncbi:TPA: hypothetical protein SMI09_003940 [Serratia marcescens]|nr:hypothetical protein [Serratia marcescens]HEJ7960544.1 hypothetical protein [Serratia marcescens]
MEQLTVNNKKIAAKLNCLARVGLKVVECHVNFRRPVIEVEAPLQDWVKGAEEITETRNGIKRTVKMTIWHGAHIIWC